MSKSLSIGKKIGFGLCILALSYVIMMGFGFTVGQQRRVRLRELSECVFPASQQSQLALLTFKDQIKLYNDAVTLRDESLIASAQVKIKEIQKALQTIAGLKGIDDKKMSEVREILKQFDDFVSSAQAVYTAMSSVSEEGDMTSYGDEALRLGRQADDLREGLTSLSKACADDLEAMLTVISVSTNRFWYLNLIVFLGVIFGALLLVSIFMTRSIVSPIKGVIEEVKDSALHVTSASAQISEASQKLAEGANDQASGLEESSSSLEEMSVMTKQNADSARQANTLAVGTREAAEKGNEAMQRMSRAIEDIKKSSDETAKIIKTIDEIAFQTNLLALNAAVEAARAGEAGKGFAVVAEEVRNLAQRSAEAARNTTSLIEESKNNSDGGVKVSQEVGAILEEIVSSARKVTDLVGEVAAASEEQSKGIDQVNDAVAQMNKTTQENASNAEESASASQELNAQGVHLKGIVAKLVVQVGGVSAEGINGYASALKVPGGHGQAHYRDGGKGIHGVLHEGKGRSKETKTGCGTQGGVKAAKPEEIIPLDDEDFKDF